jgi:outer membrane biogenesis lipoprotein LolB
MSIRRVVRAFASASCLFVLTGCHSPARTPPAAEQREPQTTWRTLGSWSGAGNVQTESFTSDSGALRIHWKTTAHAGAAPPGTFVLTIHSSISGRPLQVAVDEQGPGENTTFVSDDPHVFFAKVESQGLDWSFTVEEGFPGSVAP